MASYEYCQAESTKLNPSQLNISNNQCNIFEYTYLESKIHLSSHKENKQIFSNVQLLL